MRIGFDEQGGECVFSSEKDTHAKVTYELNFNEAPEGDIREIEAESIPSHDLLLAGFPCQPFSIAGVTKLNSMGLEHGLLCVGCCWMMMLLLFAVGVMNLFWVASLAVPLVFALPTLSRCCAHVFWNHPSFYGSVGNESDVARRPHNGTECRSNIALTVLFVESRS